MVPLKMYKTFYQNALRRAPIIGWRLKNAESERAYAIKKSRGTIENLIRVLADRQALVHSVPKSGVTWTLLMLSNYMARTEGSEDVVGFDEMNRRYIIHSVENRSGRDQIATWLRERSPLPTNAFNIQTLIHTHLPVRNIRYKRAIFLCRNPYDFVLSFHYFKTEARGLPKKISEARIEKYIAGYISLIQYQVEQLDQAGKDVLILPYEALRADPRKGLTRVLEHLGLNVIDDDLITQAIDASSVKAIREYEQKGGTVVSEELKKSFIRAEDGSLSSKSLSERQRNLIERLLPQRVSYHLQRVGCLSRESYELNTWTGW